LCWPSKARQILDHSHVLTTTHGPATDAVMGQRVSAQVELEGLDIPEMGAVAYPDFVLKADAMGVE